MEKSEDKPLIHTPDDHYTINNTSDSQKFAYQFDDEGHGSTINCIFNLATSAIGGGVLAFPFAYSATGLISGLVITVIMIAVMGYTQHIISESTERTRSSNYNQLVTRMLGPRWGIACEIILILYLLGAVIAFMSIIGELGEPIIKRYVTDKEFWGSGKVLIAIFSTAIILPLCLLRRIDKLGMASAIAILPVIYLGFMVIIDGATAESKHETAPISYSIWTIQFFNAFPLIVFAYQSHIQVPVIYAEQKKRSVRQMDIVIFFAMLLESVLYIGGMMFGPIHLIVLVGSFGYLLYGNETKGTILLNYSDGDIPANIARVLLVFHFTLATPINFFPARLALSSLVDRFRPPSSSTEAQVSHMPWKRFLIITLSMFVPCLIIAIAVPQVQIVFSIIGSTLGVAVVFFFPALFAWKHHRNIVLTIIGGILSSFIAITGTGITIYDMVK